MTGVDAGGSIDELLGPAESRFFGAGFRGVEHELAGLRVGVMSNGRWGVAGTASLTYPTEWSTKQTRSDLTPHLSTVDAFVLAVELIDLLLVKQFSLSPQERASAWIRSVEFRSGSAPLESLTEVAVWASVVSVARARCSIEGPYQSVVDAVIGAIKLRVVVCHEFAGFVERGEDLADGAAVLGAAEDRFYGTGYKQHRHRIDGLRFGPDGHALTARVQVARDTDREYSADLGGAYRPSVSILDCVIAQSQITQALLYSLDGLDRQESNTLWMRRVTIEARTPYRSIEQAFEASTRVDKTELVKIRGAVFRSTDFSGTFQGLSSRYSLAHELPQSVVSALPASAQTRVG